MSLTAGDALALMVKTEELKNGSLYPSLKKLRTISLDIVVAVAGQAYRQNLARMSHPDNLREYIRWACTILDINIET